MHTTHLLNTTKNIFFPLLHLSQEDFCFNKITQAHKLLKANSPAQS